MKNPSEDKKSEEVAFGEEGENLLIETPSVSSFHEKRKKARFENQTGRSWDEERYKSRKELRRKFNALRAEIHSEMKRELSKRIENNPTPTDEEIMLGAFWEEIEPQVRIALKELHRKGYYTRGSGFLGEEDADRQMISGWFGTEFEKDEKTADLLQEFGAEYSRFPSTLEFESDEADVVSLEKKWKEIVAILPDKGTPCKGIFVYTTGAEEFRKKYARSKQVKALERAGRGQIERMLDERNEWYREDDRPERQIEIAKLEQELASAPSLAERKKIKRAIEEQKALLLRKNRNI